MSRDPLGDVDGPNEYTYCGNDGVNGVDPMGLNKLFGAAKGIFDAVNPVNIVTGLYQFGVNLRAVVNYEQDVLGIPTSSWARKGAPGYSLTPQQLGRGIIRGLDPRNAANSEEAAAVTTGDLLALLSITGSISGVASRVGAAGMADALTPAELAAGMSDISAATARPGGVLVQKVGSVFVKGVNPSSSAIIQAYARLTISQQAAALKKLGSMAAPFAYQADD